MGVGSFDETGEYRSLELKGAPAKDRHRGDSFFASGPDVPRAQEPAGRLVFRGVLTRRGVLNGDSRQRILETVAVDGAVRPGSIASPRAHAHACLAGGSTADAARAARRSYHQAARAQCGFHLLHDWDGKADRVNEDIIPVDVLHFLGVKRGAGRLRLDLGGHPARLLPALCVDAACRWRSGTTATRTPTSTGWMRWLRELSGAGRQRPAVRGRRRDALPAGGFALRARRPRLRRAVDTGCTRTRRISSKSRLVTPPGWEATSGSDTKPLTARVSRRCVRTTASTIRGCCSRCRR